MKKDCTTVDNDLIYRVYDEDTGIVLHELNVGDMVKIDGKNYHFIGVIENDDEIPIEYSVIYLRKEDGIYYRKPAIDLETLLEMTPKEDPETNERKMREYIKGDETDLLDTRIKDTDNDLVIMVKKFFAYKGITKGEFKSVFEEKPADYSNTLRKLEEGQLTWKRFTDILQRFNVHYELTISELDPKTIEKVDKNNSYYIPKKTINPRHFKIYTDGSYSPSTGRSAYAYAIYCIEDKIEYLVKSEASLLPSTLEKNEGEIASIEKALEKISNDFQICINDSIQVISDSKSIINSMIFYIDTWKENNWKRLGSNAEVAFKDYYIRILNIMQTLPVKINWVWCKAHNGNPGNEKVDAMCREVVDNIERSMGKNNPNKYKGYTNKLKA